MAPSRTTGRVQRPRPSARPLPWARAVRNRSGGPPSPCSAPAVAARRRRTEGGRTCRTATAVAGSRRLLPRR
eukprot:2365369-Prymnesium_polylepis.3